MTKKITGEQLAALLYEAFQPDDYFDGINLIDCFKPLPKQETANPDHALIHSVLNGVATKLNALILPQRRVCCDVFAATKQIHRGGCPAEG